MFERDRDRCSAETHDPRCSRRAEEAHHVVYKSHLSRSALWVVENGIALSLLCHALAHRTHNANIGETRKRAAVDAVNPLMRVRIPHFT